MCTGDCHSYNKNSRATLPHFTNGFPGRSPILKFLGSEVISRTLAHFHEVLPYVIIRHISKMSSFVVEDDLKVEQTVGMGNGILLTWNYDPNMTCDYVIKWCNTSQPQPCLMDWKKVPADSTEAVIESGACSEGAPGAGSGE